MAILTECIRGGSLDRHAGWLIRFGYHTALVEELKSCIPHTHREWRDEEKRWWVSDEYERELYRMFTNFEALAYNQMSMF